MAPPQSLEAARLAGIRAARQASAVYRAIVQGPQAPAPAGWGVEVPVFQKALPRLNLKELVNCSRHFGQRGHVVGPLAAELAAEVSRRLKEQATETAGKSSSSTAAGDAAKAARLMNAQEVTAVTYSFSKLSPQLPEYSVLYNEVADGLLEGLWKLNRMQSALLSTAFADVELRMVDALPALLRPILHDLASSEQAKDAASVDELRFLVHAAVRLPSPGLTAQEVEALADCTMRHLQKASFSSQAHLAVSWLRLCPPPEAKKVHLDALRSSCCALLEHEKSHFPAHPLPQEGLAPAVAALMAREVEQNAPPLVPPAMRDITKGLAQISWGLQRYQTSSSRGRSLGIDDWSEILQLVVGFCEAHSAAAVAASSETASNRSRRQHLSVTTSSVLPAWAAEVLYHVLWRAQQLPEPREDSSVELVELGSLLTLLRLVRRHKAKPAPDAAFFSWAAALIAAHRSRGTAAPGLLAEVVGELVPLLPKEERGSLARMLVTSGGMHKAHDVSFASAGTSPQEHLRLSSPRLLAGSVQSSSMTVKLVAPPAPVPELAVAHAASEVLTASSPTLGQAVQLAEGGKLWGMLASQARAKSPSAQASSEELSAVRSSETVVKSSPETAFLHAQEPAVDDKPSRPQLAAASAEEMQQLLQQALQRVEALETRLKEQEERQEAEAKKAAAAPSQSRAAARREAWTAESAGTSVQHGLEQSSAWLASIFQSPAERIQPSPAAATLHLNSSFNFEEFRRSQSTRLQSERLRVVVPPSNYPMWPLPKK